MQAFKSKPFSHRHFHEMNAKEESFLFFLESFSDCDVVWITAPFNRKLTDALDYDCMSD